jgi:hypothetical protein
MEVNLPFAAQLLPALSAALALIGGLALAEGNDTNGKDEHETSSASEAAGAPAASREPDAIYQKGKLVARVLEPEINEAGKEVRFTQVIDQEDLSLPDECEFRKYILMVRRVSYATKERSERRERVLKGVVAEIVGYWEQ